MNFRISIPEQPDKIVSGTYSDAVKAFEQALWDTGILPDNERLTATDLGFAGGISLETVLETQGFINYGTGSNLPSVAVQKEE